MNIFALDSNPILAARYHNDRHCVKMIVEYAQLLSTAHHVLDQGLSSVDLTAIPKATHRNHPCAIWVRERSANYQWLYRLWVATLGEFRTRYQHPHSYEALVHQLMNLPLCIRGSRRRQPFVQCVPDEYRRGNAIEAYRAYYLGAKRHIATWKVGAPAWWR
jgi:hypothetical protein